MYYWSTISQFANKTEVIIVQVNDRIFAHLEIAAVINIQITV